MSRFVPGLILSCFLAALATLLGQVRSIADLHLNPFLLAILLGVVVGNAFVLGPRTQHGITFALRPLLRAGIVLLGFRLALGDVVALGLDGVATIALLVAGSMGLAYGLGRVLGVDPKLSLLIAAGHAICGASAVLATDAVLRCKERDTVVAVGLVTIFGTLAMFLDPVIGRALDLESHTYGFWVGASVHEVAQVIGAGLAFDEVAGDHATLVKLTRVAFLVPVTLLMCVGANRAHGTKGIASRAQIPWFVVGFVLCAGVHSADLLPHGIEDGIGFMRSAALTTAMAALGLRTQFRDLVHIGPRPFALGLIVTVAMSAAALWLA
jgi:uncharacterized integral membrane protein (TIGR00698 family)